MGTHSMFFSFFPFFFSLSFFFPFFFFPFPFFPIPRFARLVSSSPLKFHHNRNKYTSAQQTNKYTNVQQTNKQKRDKSCYSSYSSLRSVGFVFAIERKEDEKNEDEK